MVDAETDPRARLRAPARALATFGIPGGGQGWKRVCITHPPLKERSAALRRSRGNAGGPWLLCWQASNVCRNGGCGNGVFEDGVFEDFLTGRTGLYGIKGETL